MPIPAMLSNLSLEEKCTGNAKPVDEPVQSPFPAATKQVAGLVNGTATDVTSIYFADRIILTISQGGRLSQWVRHRIFFR